MSQNSARTANGRYRVQSRSTTRRNAGRASGSSSELAQEDLSEAMPPTASRKGGGTERDSLGGDSESTRPNILPITSLRLPRIITDPAEILWYQF